MLPHENKENTVEKLAQLEQDADDYFQLDEHSLVTHCVKHGGPADEPKAFNHSTDLEAPEMLLSSYSLQQIQLLLAKYSRLLAENRVKKLRSFLNAFLDAKLVEGRMRKCSQGKQRPGEEEEYFNLADDNSQTEMRQSVLCEIAIEKLRAPSLPTLPDENKAAVDEGILVEERVSEKERQTKLQDELKTLMDAASANLLKENE